VAPSLDVYSLASTFFHLVTGSPPFPSSRIADLKKEIGRACPDPDPRCGGLPELLERIIRAGLAADPGQRPTLKEFVATLRGTLNQLLVDTFTMSRPDSGSVPPTELSTGAVVNPPSEPPTEPEPRRRLRSTCG